MYEYSYKGIMLLFLILTGYFEDRQFPPVVALRGVTIKQPFEWKRPWVCYFLTFFGFYFKIVLNRFYLCYLFHQFLINYTRMQTMDYLLDNLNGAVELYMLHNAYSKG